MTHIYREADAKSDLLSKLRSCGYRLWKSRPSEALNLRDSGASVIIGNIDDDYRTRAIQEGFPVVSIAEAVRSADVVMMLLPDEVLNEVFPRDVIPGLCRGKVLSFASGYGVTYGTIQPPADVDVILIAPRMIGVGVRDLFVSGEGYFSFVAIHQDVSGLAKDVMLAIALGIGTLRKGAVEVTFKIETELDLFNEQAFGPAFGRVLLTAMDTLIKAGYPREAVLLEFYLSGELSFILRDMAEHGLIKQLDCHSQTSQYGALSRGIKFIGLNLARPMRKILDNIRGGKFAREWSFEERTGKLRYRFLRHMAKAPTDRCDGRNSSQKAWTRGMSGFPARRYRENDFDRTEASSEEIHLAVHRGRFASENWRRLTARQRTRFLRSFRHQLVHQMDPLLAVVHAETAKPRFDLAGEVFHAANLCQFLERQTPRWMRPERRPTGWFVHKRATVLREPLGVVAAITPCNYPIVLFLTPALQALAAGNAIIVKPSEWTPETSSFLRQIFDDSGVPENVIQVVNGGPATGRLLAGSGVDKVFFTGGREGGRSVYKAAAEWLTPVVLELGGNDPMIVCEDADIERAAHAAVWGAFFNAGQSCIAVERCYVHRDQFDEFTRRVVELTHRVTTGWKESADQLDFDMGPIATEVQFEHLLLLLNDAKRRGAKVLAGGHVIDRTKHCFAPTVLARVDHSMRIMKEETFGPILPIQSFEDEEEAISLANDSELGLGASIWSRRVRRAKKIASALEVGGVVINDTMVHFGMPSLPFGGRRGSGFGRSQGIEGFEEFVQTKSIVTHRWGPRVEWQWFPNGNKHLTLTRACRWLLG